MRGIPWCRLITAEVLQLVQLAQHQWQIIRQFPLAMETLRIRQHLLVRRAEHTQPHRRAGKLLAPRHLGLIGIGIMLHLA